MQLQWLLKKKKNNLGEKHAWLGSCFSSNQNNDHHQELEIKALKSLDFYIDERFL